jgi:hypothetical protein
VHDPHTPKPLSHATSLLTCANPSCGNEFERKSGRGRPRLFCTPACRVAAFQQGKSPGTDPRNLQNVAETKIKAKLTRVPFQVSRLMEFCTKRELQNQTGHSASQWLLVIIKELLDNALDACEEAEIAPVITVTVKPGSISIRDNGGGIAAETIAAILDYSIRVSSREAYVSPSAALRATRSRQSWLWDTCWIASVKVRTSTKKRWA